MSFVIPVALQIHFFSKNKNDAGYMQEPNRTLLIITFKIVCPSGAPISSRQQAGLCCRAFAVVNYSCIPCALHIRQT